MSDTVLEQQSGGQGARPLVDLDAYFARIGYRGPRAPTLATLRALHELHPATIAFEAMDVLLGRSIDLDPAAVDAKLIDARRGGYCHEHNGLFKRVLLTLGFKVENLIARVGWMVPPGMPLPRGHFALRVMVDGEPWLADVGFGGCVPTAPLRMIVNEPQATQHESFRLVPSHDGFMLEALRGDSWLPMYELMDKPQIDADLTMMNWFTATHPDSVFKRHLMAALTTPEARYGLRDNRFTVRFASGHTEHHALGADDVAQALTHVFKLPVQPSWRAVIERFVPKA
jgi:N-hydroxyarylamine O-acetyltransferase